MADNPREFFERMQGRIDPDRTRGTTGSYRFDVEGAGSWHVAIDDGDVAVSESDDPADCVIRTSEKTFMGIVRREQNPTTAYMTGKLRVEGDLGLAMKLQKLFG